MESFNTPKGTELPLINLKGKPYLQVQHRLIWFREEHPDWSISTEIRDFNEKFSIGKATISDGSGKVLATAHKQEHAGHFPDYMEKSETGAVGRALALVGYGTQFAIELDEHDRIVDAPAHFKVAPPASEPIQNVKQSVKPKLQEAPRPAQPKAVPAPVVTLPPAPPQAAVAPVLPPPPPKAAPEGLSAVNPAYYVPTVGKFAAPNYKGKTLSQIDENELATYTAQFLAAMAQPNAPAWTKRPDAIEYAAMAQAYLNRPKPRQEDDVPLFEQSPTHISSPDPAPKAATPAPQVLGDYVFTFGMHTGSAVKDIPLDDFTTKDGVAKLGLRNYLGKLNKTGDEPQYVAARTAVAEYLKAVDATKPVAAGL